MRGNVKISKTRVAFGQIFNIQESAFEQTFVRIILTPLRFAIFIYKKAVANSNSSHIVVCLDNILKF